MIEAMKQALEALEMVQIDVKTTPNAYEAQRQAIAAGRQAIAEAEKQEPVAYLCEPDENGLYGLPTTDKACDKCFPVYRGPLANQTKREWVGLTPDDMLVALISVDPETKRLPIGFVRFAEAIEAKLKEKNA